jgi:hypothetical protein
VKCVAVLLPQAELLLRIERSLRFSGGNDDEGHFYFRYLLRRIDSFISIVQLTYGLCFLLKTVQQLFLFINDFLFFFHHSHQVLSLLKELFFLGFCPDQMRRNVVEIKINLVFYFLGQNFVSVSFEQTQSDEDIQGIVDSSFYVHLAFPLNISKRTSAYSSQSSLIWPISFLATYL